MLMPIQTLWSLATLSPGIALCAQCLHDVEQFGWQIVNI